EELEELFADLWQVPGFAGLRRGFRPHVDCYRTEDPPAVTIVVDLAGVDPEHVAIEVTERTVLISGVRSRLPLGRGASYRQLAIGQERSVQLVDDVVSGDRMLALVTVKNEEADPPAWDDLYEVGTAAIVHKLIRVPDGTLRILVQGVRRIRLDDRISDDPYLV